MFSSTLSSCCASFKLFLRHAKMLLLLFFIHHISIALNQMFLCFPAPLPYIWQLLKVTREFHLLCRPTSTKSNTQSLWGGGGSQGFIYNTSVISACSATSWSVLFLYIQLPPLILWCHEVTLCTAACRHTHVHGHNLAHSGCFHRLASLIHVGRGKTDVFLLVSSCQHTDTLLEYRPQRETETEVV